MCILQKAATSSQGFSSTHNVLMTQTLSCDTMWQGVALNSSLFPLSHTLIHSTKQSLLVPL